MGHDVARDGCGLAIGTLAIANPQVDGLRRYSWAARLGRVVSKRPCAPLKLAFAGKQTECCSAHNFDVSTASVFQQFSTADAGSYPHISKNRSRQPTGA
jgi:hypothetical protein